jgi:hypothetical protein
VKNNILVNSGKILNTTTYTATKTATMNKIGIAQSGNTSCTTVGSCIFFIKNTRSIGLE